MKFLKGDRLKKCIRLEEGNDVAYLCISKVSIYISSPQGLVRHRGLFDIDYHFKLIK